MSLKSYESYSDHSNTNTVILNNGDYVAFIDFESEGMPSGKLILESGSGKLILENGEWRIDYFKDDKMNTFKFDADKLDKLKHGEIILSNANNYFIKPTKTPEQLELDRQSAEKIYASSRLEDSKNADFSGGKRSRRRRKTRKSRKSRR